MLKALFQNRIISTLVIVGMLSITALSIMKTPDIMILKRITAHAIQFMLLLLGAGLFFLAIDQKRLLFAAFGCVAALCLHFKRVANISLILPIKTSEPTLMVAQTSTSDLAEHWQNSIQSLIRSKADIISILELTPDWEALLTKRLAKDYPYHALNTRIDILGSAIFSKFPVVHTDTLNFMDVPHLKSVVEIPGGLQTRIYSFNTNPPLLRNSLLQLRNELGELSDDIQKEPIPAIATGNYNLDQFADEIQDFRASADLLDSRKTMSPSLFTPTNHIFYSRSFECLHFANLYDTASVRIGIIGEYQFLKNDAVDSD
ncbi:MAG: endonuclease/exonuclease/phosphatase family protein [Saprospiraceae bacterium]|nr:endonuclease/exonuclease/phosphatase family protein [Saprospiraceae bacterium]